MLNPNGRLNVILPMLLLTEKDLTPLSINDGLTVIFFVIAELASGLPWLVKEKHTQLAKAKQLVFFFRCSCDQLHLGV